MKRAVALTAGALLALAGCGGQGHKWPDPHPALWEVTGPGGQHGWLFGTIHAVPESARWRTGPIDDAFAKSSLLVVEIADLGNADEAKSEFYRLSTTPGQPPLSQRVPAADRPALATLLEQAGLGDGDFPDTETWGAAIILANRVRSGDPEIGVDRTLIAQAKRVEGLETFAQQYGVFDRLPQAEQADLLVATAADAAGNEEGKEFTEWLTGDLEGLERDADASVLANPQLKEALQTGRNRAWDARIEQLLADHQTPFVAVGTAHMFGSEGLPALLAAHGYTVRRIE